MAGNVSFAAALLAVSLLLGTLGYHWTDRLPWVDSLLNATMILMGMGPVAPLTTTGAKLFATFFAIFAGTMFLTTAALVLVPVAHRVLHRFHLELQDDGSGADAPTSPPKQPKSDAAPDKP